MKHAQVSGESHADARAFPLADLRFQFRPSASIRRQGVLPLTGWRKTSASVVRQPSLAAAGRDVMVALRT